MTATKTQNPVVAPPTPEQIRAARRALAGFVAAAGFTGAVPAPAASAAIVVENAVMVGALARILGQPITVADVIAAFGVVGAANQVGRAVFIEGARWLGWGGGPAVVVAVSGLGALTAAAQTWLIGEVVILLATNGGAIPTAKELARLQSRMWTEARKILGPKTARKGRRKGGRRRGRPTA